MGTSKESKESKKFPNKSVAGELLFDPTSVAYIPPDSDVLIVGIGKRGELPMCPALYVLPEYVTKGSITINDLPPSDLRGGLHNAEQVGRTMLRLYEAFQAKIPQFSFELHNFFDMWSSTERYDVIFDHLTIYHWIIEQSNRYPHTDHLDAIVNLVNHLLVDNGKLYMFYNQESVYFDKQRLVDITDFECRFHDSGMEVTKIDSIVDVYPISPDLENQLRIHYDKNHEQYNFSYNMYWPIYMASGLLIVQNVV